MKPKDKILFALMERKRLFEGILSTGLSMLDRLDGVTVQRLQNERLEWSVSVEKCRLELAELDDCIAFMNNLITIVSVV